MDPAERARRTGPRELSVEVTTRYRVMRWLDVFVVRALFDIRVELFDEPRPLVLRVLLVHRVVLALPLALVPVLYFAFGEHFQLGMGQ